MLLKLDPELTEMVVGFLAPPLGFQPRELAPTEDPDSIQAALQLHIARSRFEAFLQQTQPRIKPIPGEDEVEIFPMMCIWDDWAEPARDFGRLAAVSKDCRTACALIHGHMVDVAGLLVEQAAEWMMEEWADALSDLFKKKMITLWCVHGGKRCRQAFLQVYDALDADPDDQAEAILDRLLEGVALREF